MKVDYFSHQNNWSILLHGRCCFCVLLCMLAQWVYILRNNVNFVLNIIIILIRFSRKFLFRE